MENTAWLLSVLLRHKVLNPVAIAGFLVFLSLFSIINISVKMDDLCAYFALFFSLDMQGIGLLNGRRE